MRYVEETEAALRVGVLGPQHVERLRGFYADQDYAPRTISMYTQKLKQAFNHGLDLGLLSANPVARVKQLPVDNVQTRLLQMDDLVRILHAARHTDAQDTLLTMALTGLRPSDVRLLTADEVDGDIIHIAADKTKGGRVCIIPASVDALHVLARRDPQLL